MNPPPPSAAPPMSPFSAWGNVVMAAVLMLATLPGRTQGLGLITEPMLADLKLDRLEYAEINLWATLLGSVLCLPIGWVIDRFGLRGTAIVVLALLAVVVWQMSAMAGGVMIIFLLITLTRALGQSALSVISITTVGKSFGLKAGWAMGVYSVLLSLFMAAAFLAVGYSVSALGWRIAWEQVAISLVVILILVAVLLRKPAILTSSDPQKPGSGLSLLQALRSGPFWVFSLATALFALVASGMGLFNESILAERGFDQKTYHTFMGVTTLLALVGQLVCGHLSRRHSLPRLLAMAMFIYALGLAALPLLQTQWQLWLFAIVFGIAAGFITVIFFAVWGQAYGQAHLGRIQGAAQMITVIASALGPLLFASSHAMAGTYNVLLYSLAPIVFAVGILAWLTKLRPPESA